MGALGGVTGDGTARSTPKLRTAEIKIRPSIPDSLRASSIPCAIPSRWSIVGQPDERRA